MLRGNPFLASHRIRIDEVEPERALNVEGQSPLLLVLEERWMVEVRWLVDVELVVVALRHAVY